MNNKYFYITQDGLTIEVPFKTKNGNYMVYHSINCNVYRFINSEGKHIRWIDETEVKYLKQVLEPIGENEYFSFPEVVEERELPTVKTVWQHIDCSENPELSNNGGCYDHLYRIVEENGWDTDSLNGFFLIENHLYNSDFEEQGWVTVNKFDSLEDVHSYIESFKVGEPA